VSGTAKALHSTGLWHYWRIFSLSCSLLIWTACTAKEAKLPDAEPPVTLPEVRRIVFQGNTTFSSGQLRKVMATKQRPLLPPWKRGELYNPPTVEADVRRLKKFYFDRGFLDTAVSVSKNEEAEETGTVRLEIRIVEGPRALVTAVRLEGTVPELPAAEKLLAELPLRPGEPITKATFDSSKDLLLTRLRDAGYARAQIVPRTEVNTESHTAVVTFQLYPGARTVFGRITVKGAQRVNERAIRRKITVREGETYSANKLTESADAIYGLGMFQAVTPRAVNFDQADAPLDIEMEVRERKPRTIQLGAGFSSVERFRLQVEWTHRNLFDGAEKLTVSGKVSSVEQVFEARLHLPYFLSRHTTFTQTIFVRNEQEVNTDPLGLSDALFNIEDAQPAFDLFSVGGETRIAYQFSRQLTGFAGLQLSSNQFTNVDVTALPDGELAEDNTILSQFVEARWNTSDSLLNPTRGVQLRGRLEHSNAAIISDVSFAKILLEGRYYRRIWWQMILATRLEIGTIQPYGDTQEVPFNVRFFAGGPGSVRGFTLNRLGPLDDKDNPIGGSSLIEGSLELRFPIAGDFGGVLFLDFGNVFREAFTYHLDDLRYAVGPGLRYKTPIGPVRVDFGIIADRRSGEDFGRVEFSIGQAF
jgi:outer membrane protein insertion porin family/translocation and assembly module TamA